jgi:hypothetical protein
MDEEFKDKIPLDKQNERKITKEDDIMSTIKPIQATPVLSGNDAVNLMKEVLRAPSESAIQKNKMLVNVLKNIKK